jgi:hypothetical protein
MKCTKSITMVFKSSVKSEKKQKYLQNLEKLYKDEEVLITLLKNTLELTTESETVSFEKVVDLLGYKYFTSLIMNTKYDFREK